MSLIEFDDVANFQRLTSDIPLLSASPQEWAAAAHVIVVEDIIHYLWGRKKIDDRWEIMHSYAKVITPIEVQHDSQNPILVATVDGFDNYGVEYPFPFHNPTDGGNYAYYLGQRTEKPRIKQTGLLSCGRDWSCLKRVSDDPVLGVSEEYELHGSSHPSAVVVDDVIHIVYTAEAPRHVQTPGSLYNVPTICYAKASACKPEKIEKSFSNPVFRGSGADWDRRGVREAEILYDGTYFHLFYGGYDGKMWSIGHVRTTDFLSFDPNPNNPIFVPSVGSGNWDSDGLLTPQVFWLNGELYMIYAGLRGYNWGKTSEVSTGLAIAVGKGKKSK